MNSYRIPQSEPLCSPETGGHDAPRIIPLMGRSIRESGPPDWNRVYRDGLARPCILLPNPDRTGYVVLDSVALSSGVLAIGGIGSGKTNVIREIVRQLLEQVSSRDTVIIFDTKGDYARAFYDPGNPNHVILGSPDTYPTATLWNLFGEVTSLDSPGAQRARREEMNRARSLAKRMFAGRESESQPFFTLTAMDLMAKAMIHLIRQSRMTGDRSLLCNSALRDFFRKADPDVWRRVLTQDNPDFKASAVYFGGSRGDMGASILATLNSAAEDLLGSFFGDGGPQDTFSIRSAMRQGGKTIFIEYDMEIAEVLIPVYSLLVDQAIKIQTAQGGNKAGKLYLVVDELKLLNLQLDDAVNFGRGQGVHVVAACQNVNQIINEYGRERAMSMLNGYSTCFAFRNPDSETRDCVSARFGKIYQSVVCDPLRKPLAVMREGHTLEDCDLLSLKRGQAAVEIAWQEKPFLFQFAQY